MRHVFVLGAGTIGSLIAGLLSRSGDYAVYLADHDENALKRATEDVDRQNLTTFTLEAIQGSGLRHALSDYPCEAVISALPYY